VSFMNETLSFPFDAAASAVSNCTCVFEHHFIQLTCRLIAFFLFLL
jgi:hypothetical protein